MIEIKNLSVSFEKKTVLKNININFPLQNIHGIVGLNGAGKTTFFNALSTSLKGEEGEILYQESILKKKDTGYLETVNYFYSRITGNEYLNIFNQTNTSFNLTTLQTILKLPLDELVETYSTGMRKKLALLGMLKQNKSIYLLDEPFNGLDLETNKALEIILMALKEKGKTIFISSHIIDPLLTVCDEIHFLENGNFIKKYTKTEFHKIEEELFGNLKAHIKEIIMQAV